MSPKTGRPAKLDPRLQNFARRLYFARLATQQQLARFLGCSQPTIHRIVSR